MNRIAQHQKCIAILNMIKGLERRIMLNTAYSVKSNVLFVSKALRDIEIQKKAIQRLKRYYFRLLGGMVG
jgi:hypothetical protein